MMTTSSKDTPMMYNNDGYSTPVSFPEDQDSHGPLVPPPTPRHEKQMIGVKRLPSDLALPDLDGTNDTMDAVRHEPFRQLKPRIGQSSFLPFDSNSTIPQGIIEAAFNDVVLSHHPHKRARRHSFRPNRASLARRESAKAARGSNVKKPSRADFCDF